MTENQPNPEPTTTSSANIVRLSSPRRASSPRKRHRRRGGNPGTLHPTPGGQYDASGKVGRNEPCPCGSGRKSKKCHASWNRPVLAAVQESAGQACDVCGKVADLVDMSNDSVPGGRLGRACVACLQDIPGVMRALLTKAALEGRIDISKVPVEPLLAAGVQEAAAVQRAGNPEDAECPARDDDGSCLCGDLGQPSHGNKDGAR